MGENPTPRLLGKSSKELTEYYVEQFEEDRAWNSFNKLQQTRSVKDYSKNVLQLILRFSNNVTEKYKL
jgi:hypothetical protein